MVLYMIVQVVVSGIVTFGIIFAANFVLHDYATFSASKIGMKIAEENILLELLISQIITAPILIKWLKDDINLDKETGFFKKFTYNSFWNNNNVLCQLFCFYSTDVYAGIYD